MSDESGKRLSAFSKDIQRIAEEVEDLAEDLEEDSQLIREEMVGAEILATTEVSETVGILWEVAEALNAIGNEQARWLIDDYLTTCRELTNAAGPYSYPDLVMNHWLRRLDHMADGARSLADLVTSETNQFEDLVFGIWKPFLAVVNRDWNPGR